MADTDLKSSENYQKATVGQNGFKDLTSSGGSAAGELFCALEAADGDAVFSATNDVPLGEKTLTSKTIKDGRFIYGRFTSITVASGTVRAYFLGIIPVGFIPSFCFDIIENSQYLGLI